MPSSSDLIPTRPFLRVRGIDVTGRKRPTSYWDVLIHYIKGNIGTGMFAMGYAYSNCGLLLGPIMMVVLALIMLNCQHILIKACVKITEQEPAPVLPSFAETVQYTFMDSGLIFLQKWSNVFAIMTDVFLIIAEYGFCICYFCFIANHLGQVADAISWKQDYRVFLAIIFVPMWLSTFLGNLKYLSPLMLIANIIMWIGCCLLMYYSVRELPPISQRSLVVSDAEKHPLYFGVVLYAFGATTFIIPIRMEMKHPEKFTSPLGVLNVGVLFSVILYGMIGVFAYWKWGDEVEGSAFMNMPQKETLSEITKLLITLGVMLTYTLHMYIAFEVLYPRFYRRFGPFKHPSLIINVFRFGAVLLTYGLANISSDLGVVISFVGSFTFAVLALIFPAMLELVMLYGQLSYFIIVKDFIFIFIGVIGGLIGTVISAKSVLETFFE